jgi:mono/diheme cytochrome c family protein
MVLDAKRSTTDRTSKRSGHPSHEGRFWPSGHTEDDMKTSIAIAVAIVILTAAAVAAAQGGMGMGMMSRSPVRHHFVMQHGIDPKYADATSPLPATADDLERGRQVYEQNCAACHGPRGFGDGPAGTSLQPPPARLVGLGRMPMTSDGYLYWTVAEGGIPVGSAMPPFKDVLKPDDIWKVILFIQTL